MSYSYFINWSIDRLEIFSIKSLFNLLQIKPGWQNPDLGHIPLWVIPAGQHSSRGSFENADKTSFIRSFLGSFCKKYPPFFPSTAFMIPLLRKSLARFRKNKIEMLYSLETSVSGTNRLL